MGTTAGIDQIAYCSVATAELWAYGQQRLVDESSRANLNLSITGLLMFEGGLIFQWIEGPSAAIALLWQRIQDDARHHCLTQLIQRKNVSKRLLIDWSMRQVSRNELIALVREAHAAQTHATQKAEWAHAMSTLSILVDPEFSAFYANALPSQPMAAAPPAPSRLKRA
jgi:hypothetical protein